MPPVLTGENTPWLLAGVLLISGTVLVFIPDFLIIGIMVLPALYCIFADKVNSIGIKAAVLLPIIPGVSSSFRGGAMVYAVILVCGFFMHHMLRRRIAGLSVFIPACFLSMVIFSAVVSASQANDMSFNQTVGAWIKAMLDNMISQYSGKLSPGDITAFNVARPAIEKRITGLFPSVVMISGIFAMWINLMIANMHLKKLDLKSWSSPEWLIVFFILFSTGVIIPSENISTISQNLLIIVCSAYFFQGFAVTASFLDSIRMWKIFRFIFYILIITQLYIMILTILLGLFDNWFYFRKRIKAKGEEI